MSLVQFTDVRDGVASMVRGALNKMEGIERDVQLGEADEGWHNKIIELIKFSTDIQQGFAIIEAFALAVLRDNWNVIDIDFRMQWGNNFYVMAYWLTDKRLSSTSSVDNRVSTARAYETFEVFNTIKVPVRDQRGIILEENGEPVYEEVEWDVTVPDITKLATAAPLARDGTLKDNPEVLTLLMDTGATVKDVKYEIYGKPKDPRPQITYRLFGPMIVAEFGKPDTEEYKVAEVAEISWTGHETEFEKAAVINMLRRLGIKLDAIKDSDMLGG